MAKKKKNKVKKDRRDTKKTALASPEQELKRKEFKVKRIRMLMSVANEKVAFNSGGVYKVGEDITPESAESYIRTGAAEEDTSLDVPEEIKETITHITEKPTEEPVTTGGEQEIEIEGEEIVGVIDSEKDEEEEAPK
ncbi:unnamed protein product, partial [marine sediment metagenome]